MSARVAPSGSGGGDGYVVLADGPHDDSRHWDRIPSASFIQKLSHNRQQNINLCMVFTFFGTLCFSIIQWNIFDAYLSFLSKHLGMKYVNSSVGFAESIAGLSSLLLAVPVGLVVDNYSRTKSLKVATVLGLIASAVSFYAFYYDSIVPLYTNLFLWGAFTQLAGSASEAIFADSMPAGGRSEYFAQKGVLERVSLSLGPAIMVGLFYFSGDDWTLHQLHIPLLLGCCLAPIPSCLIWFFKDPHPEVPFPESPASPGGTVVCNQIMAASPMTHREQLTCASPTVTLPRDANQPLDDEGRLTAEQQRFETMPFQERIIPYMVAFSDFVRKVGAGMTVKFFPLFFINDYGFRPIHINILFCTYPIGMGVATMSLQRVSKSMGRAQAALVFQLLGIAFLIGMCYLQNVWLMVIFFLLRGSFQNAGFPIDKSIIMDYVPSERRGLWNAIESITSMTWSGSAVLGGMLADVHDYRYTFLITAIIYLIAAVFYAPLLWLVPKSEQDVCTARRKQAVRKKEVPGAPSGTFEDEETDPTDSLVLVYDSDSSFLIDDKDTPLLSTSDENAPAVVNRR